MTSYVYNVYVTASMTLLWDRKIVAKILKASMPFLMNCWLEIYPFL